ncbi:MAG: ImmA/IrrE family metallo-endopeptidase [Comamonas sp.]|nr:ImmA/IrrE family metallo-endopeptidase [Comamonas sp.]
MLSVEKIAKRVLERNKLSFPFDLEALVLKYADLEYLAFPFDFDGITIGLGESGRPKILINNDRPKTRQKFTLAHELGHVIIPWHTGIVASHMSGETEGDFDYENMESEANSFASELLLPTSLINNEFKNSKNYASTFTELFEKSGVSREAFLIKTIKVFHCDIGCVELNQDGLITKKYKKGRDFLSGELKNIYDARNFINTQDFHEFSFCLNTTHYNCWVVKNKEFTEIDNRAWRDILSQILDETDGHKYLASINAILPNQVKGSEHLDNQDLYNKVRRSYQGRLNLKDIVDHSLFDQYIIKRVDELKLKFNKA